RTRPSKEPPGNHGSAPKLVITNMTEYLYNSDPPISTRLYCLSSTLADKYPPRRFMYHEFIRGPRGVSLHRVVTVFGTKEFAAIRLYCKRNRISLYALAKAAIREYMQRHP